MKNQNKNSAKRGPAVAGKIKNKIISTLIVISVIAINFAFATPAKAAISTGSLISMTNSARVSSSLKPYAVNSMLSSSAYAKAQDMLKYDYFAHTSPQGKSPWSFIKNAGYSYIFAGENLAIDFQNSSAVFAAWMASSTHRSNILDKDFTEIGIAAVTGDYQGRMTTVVVQHFGARIKISQKSIVNNSILVQNTNQTQSVLNEKPKKIKLVKIELELENPQSIILKENNPKNIIWYTSPVLYLIKALS